MHAILPGRRALGETWNKVTVRPDASGNKLEVIVAPTLAPPEMLPIIVVAGGQMEIEQAEYALEWTRQKESENSGKPKNDLTPAEFYKQLNEMWQDYLRLKIAWLQGQTTIGPGGMHQRQSPGLRRR